MPLDLAFFAAMVPAVILMGLSNEHDPAQNEDSRSVSCAGVYARTS
jgi:hypothetical protein